MILGSDYSLVRDYNKDQGYSDPSDEIGEIRRDLNIRLIQIENASKSPIGVSITTYVSGPVPPILFSLVGQEIKHLGINNQGGPTQYLWLIDLETDEVVSDVVPLRKTSRGFVLREGINKWQVQFYAYPSYSAAH